MDGEIRTCLYNRTTIDIKYEEMIENIDFKAITNEAVTELGNMPLVKRTGRNPHGSKIQVSHDIIESRLLFAVWDKSLGVLNGQAKMDGTLAVEKALAIMNRKSAVNDKIQFRKNSFRVQMENSQYRIFKMDVKDIYACPWPSERRCRILVSGETLADFMIRFDKEIPDIVSHVETIMATIRARELEKTKHAMEKEIKDNLVQALIGQYLKPLGLSVLYHIDAEDIVSLDIRKIMSGHIEVPLGELADKLKDTSGVIDSLVVEVQEIGSDSEYVDDFSGLIP